MTTVWCPRCQKQVMALRREVVDEAARTKRRQTNCFECGALIEAKTEKLPPEPED